MKFELIFSAIDEKGRIISHEKVYTDSFFHAISQFPMIVARIQKKLHEEEMLKLRMEHDNIPF